jgi:hypothetical protein
VAGQVLPWIGPSRSQRADYRLFIAFIGIGTGFLSAAADGHTHWSLLLFSARLAG